MSIAHLSLVVVFLLFSFGLMLKVPVNNCSVMLGRSHRFMGITSTFGGGGVNMSCSRTQHGDPSNHQATGPPESCRDFGLCENKGADQLCGCENKRAE